MPRRRPLSQSFYLWMSLWMTVMSAVGFWPTYFGPLLEGTLALDPILEVHAVVFMGWMVLLVAQATLVFFGRTSLHRKLGVVGVGYAVAIVVLGLWVTLARFHGDLAAGEVREAHRGLVVPLVDMLLFAGFFGAAVVYRRRPETHKRLVLVATLVFLGPAVSRMTFLDSILQVFAVTVSPLLLGMAHDLVTRRRVHGAYLIGLAAFVASGARIPLRDSEAWFELSKWVLGPHT